MKKWLVLFLLIVGILAVFIFRSGGNVEVLSPILTPVPTIVLSESKFAVVADIHMDWDHLSRFLETAKAGGNELVVIAGDLTSLGKKGELLEAKKVLDKSGVKYFVVPGNHDLWWGQKTKGDVFAEVFSKKYQSVKINDGIKLILADNSEVGGFGEEQEKWIEGELPECKRIVCLFVVHEPLEHPLSTHVMGEGDDKVVAEAKEMQILLAESGVKAIIAGHLHYSGSYEIDGIRTYLIGAAGVSKNNQTPRFTEFVIRDSMIEDVVIKEEE